jgi:hypothetical protein
MSFDNIKDEAKQVALKLTPSVVKGIFWRILSYFISSLFFALLPITLFVIHMYDNAYFSYDFFDKGLFGLKSVFGLMMVFILIVSFFFFSFIIPVIRKKVGGKENKLSEWAPWAALSLASWMFSVVIFIQVDIENGKDFVYLLLICSMVMMHISLLIYAKPKFQFISLAIVVVFFAYTTLLFKDSVVRGVNSALISFGLGGTQCVSITDRHNSYRIDGRLLLASPDYIYVQKYNDIVQRDKSDDDIAVTYIRVDSNTIYSIGVQYCISQPSETELRDGEDEPSTESS